MKKIFVLIIFMTLWMSTSIAQSRMFILTEDRTECMFNVNTGSITNCGTTISTPGIIISDVDLDMRTKRDAFYHIVPSGDTRYDVDNIVSESTALIIECTSENGNKYITVLGFESEYVSMIFMNPSELRPNGNRRMVTYKMSHIKFFE